MKIINRFIISSFLRPFLTAFGVLMFILILMMLATHKDILFGKGLGADVLFSIIGYASVRLVVLALPVSVLVASLFTMGTFGERYELAAMRSGGVSVGRILRPMLLVTIFISLGSFYLNSFVVPLANLKFYSLIYDVQQLKPEFSLDPGHFNTSVDNYVIRIEDKNIGREMLYDIMIYDHSNGRKDERLLVADSGFIKVDPYGRYMNMWLFSGASFETVYENKGRANESQSFVRTYFRALYYNFDLKGFNLERTEEDAFASHHYMLNILELGESMDSVDSRRDTIINLLATRVREESRIDSSLLVTPEDLPPSPEAKDPNDILTRFPASRRAPIIRSAMQHVRNAQSVTRNAQLLIDEDSRGRREFEIEFHGKFSLPMACLVYLFIGAPLGAVTRKGGIGLPIVLAIVFYIAFSVLMIQGKKIALEGVVAVWFGVWLPVLVLVPMAIPLTLQALFARRISVGQIIYVLRNAIQDGLVFVLRPVVRLFRRK